MCTRYELYTYVPTLHTCISWKLVAASNEFAIAELPGNRNLIVLLQHKYKQHCFSFCSVLLSNCILWFHLNAICVFVFATSPSLEFLLHAFCCKQISLQLTNKFQSVLKEMPLFLFEFLWEFAVFFAAISQFSI